MSNFNSPDDQIRVVAVIGNEARVYAPLEKHQTRRDLLDVRTFSHRGAAMLWAAEYEDAERGALARRQGR